MTDLQAFLEFFPTSPMGLSQYHSLNSCSLRRVACRAVQWSLHFFRSFAMPQMLLQGFPICCISLFTVRRHGIFGRPLLHFLSGVQCRAVLVMEDCWWVTWPIHLHRLFVRMVAIDSIIHCSSRSLFEMVLGQKLRRIRGRLLV